MFAFQRELANNWSLNVDWIQRWFRDATTDQDCYGLPCNTVASDGVRADARRHRLRRRQPRRHRRRSSADVLRRAAAVRRQGHVLPHQLRQQRRRSTARSATRRSSSRLGKRMSNRWQMQGSYVWSRLDGDQQGIRLTARRPERVRLHQPEQPARRSSARAAARTISRTPSSCSAATRRRTASRSAPTSRR